MPVDLTITALPGAALDPALAPSRSAVVLLCDADHRPILLATTADVRAFLRKRLTTPDTADAGGPGAGTPRPAPRTDLSAIVARAELTFVGSGLEADLAFLFLARAAMPDTWEALTDRWRAWFIHLDPDAPNPVWHKTNLGDFGPAARQPDLSHLIGPIANKDTAGRFGETIDDLFDLCRFPRELALAPRGTACPYKEMGKCPAPCDGSEPMPTYRARVQGALTLLRLAPDQRGLGLDADMRDAAARQDFEAAARAKSRLNALAALAKPALREARPLDTFHFVAILGSGRPGWARAWRITPWECCPLADLNGSETRAAVGELESCILHANPAATVGSWSFPGSPRTPTPPLDPVLLGIVGRHLLAPAARRRGGFLRVRESEAAPPFDTTAAARLLRSAARTDHSDVEEFDRATLA